MRIQFIALLITRLSTSPIPVGLTPGFLFRGISLNVVSASIEKESTNFDAKFCDSKAICSQRFLTSVLNFLLHNTYRN